jgi:DNA-binding NarL/FixJ family response regulator
VRYYQAENGQAEIANGTEFTTESEVLQRIQKGESQRKLAEQNGVSKTTIANIKKMNTPL